MKLLRLLMLLSGLATARAASAKPEHQVALKNLRAVVEQWIEQTGDLGRLPDADDAAKPRPTPNKLTQPQPAKP